MQIGLTYDLQTAPADPRQAEFDPPATLEAVHHALESLGHRVLRLGGADDLLRAPERLRAVDLVFNIAEGAHGRCREAWVPTLLELYGIPYVGSDPLALALGLDKHMTKRLAAAEGIRTPPWIAVEHPQALPRPCPVRFPVMVKPRYEGSGRGIDAGAVVATPEALAARAAWLYGQVAQPLIIEEFVPFGELTVFVIGHERPAACPVIQRPLDPATRLSCHVVGPAPASWEAPLSLDEALERRAGEMAVTMFHALGCRDMARADFRVDEAGRVYFLEINPLPSFDPEGSLGLLAEHQQTTYAHLIGEILQAALRRLARASSAVSHASV